LEWGGQDKFVNSAVSREGYLVEEENGGVGGHLDAHRHALALVVGNAVAGVVADHPVGLLLQPQDLEEAPGVRSLGLARDVVRQPTLIRFLSPI